MLRFNQFCLRSFAVVICIGGLSPLWGEKIPAKELSYQLVFVKNLCENQKYDTALSLLKECEESAVGVTGEFKYRFELYNTIAWFRRQYQQHDFFIRQQKLLLPMAQEMKNQPMPDSLYVDIARFLYCSGQRREALTMIERLSRPPQNYSHGPHYLLHTNFYMDALRFEINAGNIWGAYCLLYHARSAGENFVKLKTWQSVPVDIVLKYPFTLSAWLVLLIEALLIVLPLWAIIRYMKCKHKKLTTVAQSEKLQ